MTKDCLTSSSLPTSASTRAAMPEAGGAGGGGGSAVTKPPCTDRGVKNNSQPENAQVIIFDSQEITQRAFQKVQSNRSKVDFGVHWLSITLQTLDLDAVAAWVLSPLGVKGDYASFEEIKGGYRVWKRSAIGFAGVRINSENVSTEGAGWCQVMFTGEYLEGLDLLQLAGLLLRAPAKVARGTRIDLAFDTRGFKPAEVLKEFQAGKVRTYTRRDSWSERRDGSPEKGKGGHTIYIGRRSSERMLRVYVRVDDDGQEYTRVELEVKADRADAVMRQLTFTDSELWAELCMGHLRDFIEFETAWWAAFCDNAQRAQTKVVDVAAKSLEAMKEWLRRCVAPSLFAYIKAMGGDIEAVTGLALSGRWRLSKRHRVMLAAAGVT